MRRPVDASLVALQIFLTIDFSYCNTPSYDPSTSVYILGVKSVHTQSRSFGTRFRTLLDDSSSRFLFVFIYLFFKACICRITALLFYFRIYISSSRAQWTFCYALGTWVCDQAKTEQESVPSYYNRYAVNKSVLRRTLYQRRFILSFFSYRHTRSLESFSDWGVAGMSQICPRFWRDCFGYLPGDGIVVYPPPAIVETFVLWFCSYLSYGRWALNLLGYRSQVHQHGHSACGNKGSFRPCPFFAYIFSLRCKFSTLTPRQPTVIELYLKLLYPRVHAFRYGIQNRRNCPVKIKLTLPSYNIYILSVTTRLFTTLLGRRVYATCMQLGHDTDISVCPSQNYFSHLYTLQVVHDDT